MIDDPRELGGDISGPGGPHDQGGVVIDASKAILVDQHTVAKVDQGARGQTAFAILVEGRINQSQDRAKVMLLGNLDLMAALITEMTGVARRAGLQDELAVRLRERWEQMP